ncbi:hypothetical protein JDF658_01140 [Carboxydocella sp. JDF658]|nr:hypothetical protein JDF658_01140 [Carboxydocella sp. JDF658]
MRFPSHNGSIKTITETIEVLGEQAFPSHNGSIKTLPEDENTLVLLSFHPTMVLLRPNLEEANLRGANLVSIPQWFY